MESKILKIIKNNKNWRDIIENKNIRVKDKYPYMIFNYGIDVDPTDPVVREARGIIIDMERLEVACWPFNRFYNSYEEAAREDLENFDWNNCRVEEKIDGSIVKLFWNRYSGKWQWATNGCIDAADADTVSGESFLDVIKQAYNYNQIVFESLDEEMTYIFELVSPLQQIVIYYPKTLLYHIGTRNITTGEEDWRYIGILHPEIYQLNTLDDCLSAANKLNADETQVGGEGFVVVDKDWRRLKIKSPEYVAAHKIMSNHNINKEHIIEMIKKYPHEIDDICVAFPYLAVYYRYYQFRMIELEYDVDRYITYVRNLYDEFNGDRKAVALAIKDNRLSAFGFAALKGDCTAKELLENMSQKRYMRLITDYTPHELST